MKRVTLTVSMAFALIMCAPAFAATDAWTVDTVAKTMSWTDSSGYENIVKIVISGTQISFASNANRGSATIRNLDLSLPVVDGNGAPCTISPAAMSADSTFGYNASLTNVVIHPAAEIIGRYAFKSCTALKRVTLNDGLVTLEFEAFHGDTALAAIENFLPDSVEVIGDNAFQNCKALEGDAVARGLRTIGSRAFHSCEKLHGFDCSESLVEDIPQYVFYHCYALDSVAFPAGLKTIGDAVFESDASLRVVAPFLPAGLQKLGDTKPVFFDCAALTGHVAWPINMTNIIDRTFRSAKIESFTAPKRGLKTVGQYVFYMNVSLTNIVFSEDLEKINGSLLENTGSSSLERHVWFRNLQANPFSSSLWSGTGKQKVTAHLPWSQQEAWRAWAASAPSGHTFTFNGQPGLLPEKIDDVGTWQAGVTQNVTWWKDKIDSTLITIK